MQLLLTNEEVLEIIYRAFCDGGISQLNCHGFSLDYNDIDYSEAKKKLNDPCYEDVLVQILRDGKTITFVDIEGDETNTLLTLETALKHLSLPNSIKTCVSILNEEDYDAITCDEALQLALFGKVDFG